MNNGRFYKHFYFKVNRNTKGVITFQYLTITLFVKEMAHCNFKTRHTSNYLNISSCIQLNVPEDY